MRILTRLLALLCFAGYLHAQTAQQWVKVANEGDTVAFSTPASVRYGAAQGAPAVSGTPCAKVGGCWNPFSVSGTAPMTIANGGAFGTDPIPGTVKELDVLQTNAVQNLIVNGKPVTVAALPVVTPPVTSTKKICTVPAQTFTATVNSDGSFSAPISVVVTCK